MNAHVACNKRWAQLHPDQARAQRQRHEQRYKARRHELRRAKRLAARIARGQAPLERNPGIIKANRVTYEKAYYQANSATIKERHRVWRHANGKLREYKLKKYGLTRESFQALLEQQRGCCAVCRGEFQEAWTGFVNLYPRVDHNHATGHVRGLLCHDCNVAIGHVGESVERLRAMIAYLDHSALSRHSTRPAARNTSQRTGDL